MRASELLESYKNGERNFRGVNLECANLEDTNLRGAHLQGAHLYGANLYSANLKGANLYNANLQGAHLYGANLEGSNLKGANLMYANLKGANLEGANLKYANLYNANLKGSDLKNTILDPSNKITPMSDNEIVENGFTLDGDFVYGYRTEISIHCGNTTYKPGKIYTAPYFSTCTKTDCHPGIYLAPLDWLKLRYPIRELVYVCCKKQDLLKAGDKFRARRIMILENYDPNKVEKCL